MISDRVVLWETRHSIADWVCFNTQTLLGTLRTRNQPQVESCVFSEVEQLFQFLDVQETNCCLHSSAESEIISLDAGLRMDGLPAHDLWDILIEILRSTNNNVQPKHTSIQETGAVLDSKTKNTTCQKKTKG